MKLEKSLTLVQCALLAIVCGCDVTAEPDESQDPQDTVDVVPVELEEYTNSIGMKFKLIPTGEFMMGSLADEGNRCYDEVPVHRVRITKPYYLGVHEVTQAEYELVTGENPSHFKGPTLPVEYVDWQLAVDFCQKLSAKEGRTYRLPTEAEWEYACRAGTTTRYCCGNVLGRDFAWFQGNTNRFDGNTNHRGARPIGEKRANAWGLHDMHGNVWEWCADWYGSGYYAISPMDDPAGPATGSYRVGRGGGWDYGASFCQSSGRDRNSPDYRFPYLGFRVALDPAE